MQPDSSICMSPLALHLNTNLVTPVPKSITHWFKDGIPGLLCLGLFNSR